MTKEKRETILARYDAAQDVRKYVENYHAQIVIYDSIKDIPTLLNALKTAKKTCPNGGNDGYITPRPCQCEMESLEADRDQWKTQAETLKKALQGRCFACQNSKPHSNPPENYSELLFCSYKNCAVAYNGISEHKCKYWHFNEARFTKDDKNAENK